MVIQTSEFKLNSFPYCKFLCGHFLEIDKYWTQTFNFESNFSIIKSDDIPQNSSLIWKTVICISTPHDPQYTP